MDHGCLDDLTRLMTGGVKSRRAVWQPLRGGALGMVVLRLGPAGGAAATAKWEQPPSDRREAALQAASTRNPSYG